MDLSDLLDSSADDGEPELFVEVVARYVWWVVMRWGIFIVFGFCCMALISVLFRKIYLPGLLPVWKKWLGYKQILKRMQRMLEKDYDIELWSEPAFCNSYLRLYEAFCHFRSMANRDHIGGSIMDDRHKQEEAEQLYPFFDVDYILKDRLLYAVEGTDWKPGQVQVKDEHTDELLEANTALEGKDDKGEVIEEKK